ncbi:hypothetical protein LX32DRAFT_98906 [Colletotrichum zoysiae]|uniref:Uncharacterized protein n=1 Tax=Colletotrichum zoysiae TaxID=1216348 RepID=A0AAD9H975_9PEZI|nr:hypothetical protein LX32DRAFT_98906 [Colletotrichum zoysiae]
MALSIRASWRAQPLPLHSPPAPFCAVPHTLTVSLSGLGRQTSVCMCLFPRNALPARMHKNKQTRHEHRAPRQNLRCSEMRRYLLT